MVNVGKYTSPMDGMGDGLVRESSPKSPNNSDLQISS